MAINLALARAACSVIHASQNHYSPAEGVIELRNAVAQEIALFSSIDVDPRITPHELLVAPGPPGGVIAIAHTYLKGTSALVFEPYCPYE